MPSETTTRTSMRWGGVELKQRVPVEITTEAGNRVERLAIASIGPSARPDLVHLTFNGGISRYAPRNLLLNDPLTLRLAHLCQAAAESSVLERQLDDLRREAERADRSVVIQAGDAEIGQVVRRLGTRSGMRDVWMNVTNVDKESPPEDRDTTIILTGWPTPNCRQTISRKYRHDELLEVQPVLE